MVGQAPSFRKQCELLYRNVRSLLNSVFVSSRVHLSVNVRAKVKKYVELDDQATDTALGDKRGSIHWPNFDEI
jgi:hypothetical protein